MAKKATKSKPKPTKKGSPFKLSKQNKIILGSLMVLFSIALFFSFISFYFNWQDDQSMLSEFKDRNAQAKNLLNKFGATVSHLIMYRGFGVATLILPFLICLSGIHLFFGLPSKSQYKKWIWGLLFVIWISIALGFFAIDSPLLGGLVGYEMNDFLQDYTGKIGVFLILLFGLVLILVRFFKVTPDEVGVFFKKKKASLASDFNSGNQKENTGSGDLSTTSEEDTPIVIDTYTHKKDIPPLKKESSNSDDNFEFTVPEEEVNDDLAMKVEEVVVEKEEKDNIADKLVQDFGEFDPRLELGNYKFPTMEHLDPHGVT